MAEAIIPRAVIDGNVLLHLPRAIIPRAIIPLMTELFWATILRGIIPWAGIISRGIIIRKRIVAGWRIRIVSMEICDSS